MQSHPYLLAWTHGIMFAIMMAWRLIADITVPNEPEWYVATYHIFMWVNLAMCLVFLRAWRKTQ